MDARLVQSNREALLTLALYAFFALWWCAFAFAPGSDDPETYSYVLGLPAWFFYSCVLGYVLITVMLWLVLRLGFRDMSLDDEDADGTADGNAAAPNAPAASPNAPSVVTSNVDGIAVVDDTPAPSLNVQNPSYSGTEGAPVCPARSAEKPDRAAPENRS